MLLAKKKFQFHARFIHSLRLFDKSFRVKMKKVGDDSKFSQDFQAFSRFRGRFIFIIDVGQPCYHHIKLFFASFVKGNISKRVEKVEFDVSVN
jgi:hypothetical protein